MSDSEPLEAFNLIRIMIDEVESSFSPNAVGSAKFIHETIINELKQRMIEKEHRK